LIVIGNPILILYFFDTRKTNTKSDVFISIQTFNDANGVTNQDVIDNWIERDTDACSIIYYNIEPTYQTSIEGSATSAEMWNRLAQEYAQVAVANSSQLTAKFFQYLMDPGKNILK
jgi:hypothetical protein